MAAGIDSFQLTNQDLKVLEGAFSNESFMKQLKDAIENVGSDVNLRHYECELKKYEQERGVDIALIRPSPGIALHSYDGCQRVFVNVACNDKIEEPSFSVVDTAKQALVWKVPHAVTVSRTVEGKNILDSLYTSSSSGIKTIGENDCVQIYDVIVNKMCIDAAKKNVKLKSLLIETALDVVRTERKCNLKDVEIIGFDKYIGDKSTSVLKRVYDEQKHKNSEKDDLKYPLPSITKEMNLPGDVAKTDGKAIIPTYLLKHINHITLQDFSYENERKPSSLRPNSLSLEVNLPKITKAADIDVDVRDKELKLRTKKQPFYKLEITLPYIVQSEPQSAQFDVSSQVLKLVLITSVSIPFNPLTDSGIDCESGYRTNSDIDNSSVSSQEDSSDTKLKVTGKLSSPDSSKKEVSCLIPFYAATETPAFVFLTIHASNALKKSIFFSFIDREIVEVAYTSIGGGLAPVLYGLLICVESDTIRKNGLSFKLKSNDLIFKLKKVTQGYWGRVRIGSTSADAKAVELHPKGHTIIQTATSADKEKTLPEVFDEDGYSEAEKPENVQREVESGGIDIPQSRRTSDCFFTSSWPRGILKRRSRSYSDSQMTCYSTYTTSIEEHDIEECENVDNTGDKKSVRFSGLVNEQLFKADSSILGQRIKNQKKAIRRKKNIERRLSEGDRNTVDYSDDTITASLLEYSTGLSTTSAAITTTTTEGDTTESESRSNPSTKNRKKGAKSSNRGNRGPKSRKRRKDLARMNLSNEMIFEFDSV